GDLHLGKKIDHVLRSAVELGVALLSADSLHLVHRDPPHTRLGEPVLHVIELEGLDDRVDPLHARDSKTSTSNADCGLPGTAGRRFVRLLTTRASAAQPPGGSRRAIAPSPLRDAVAGVPPRAPRAATAPRAAWAAGRGCRGPLRAAPPRANGRPSSSPRRLPP